MNLSESWERLPVMMRALAAGILAMATGQLPWSLLVAANVQVAPAIPWSVPVMAGYLGIWWWYLRGGGWPRSTSEGRRRDLRGGLPSRRLRPMALLAAGSVAVTLRALADVARRLSPRPGQDLVPQEVLAKYPFATILLLLLMTAVVSGTVEEASFRGVLQSPLERRYGPRAAILLVGAFFAIAHYRVGAPDMIPWLIFVPVYFAGAVAFGALATLSGSILPGLLAHVALNAAGLLVYWRGGIPESVRQTGFDASFWIRCAVVLVFGAASVAACRKMAAMAAQGRGE